MKKLSKAGKKWIAAIILVVLAVAVTLLATFANLDGMGPERVVKTFVQAINERNIDDLTACFIPQMQPQIQEAYAADEDGTSYFDELFPASFGENVTVSATDFNTERQEIKDGKYNGVDITELEISAIANVTYTMTVTGSLTEDADQAIAVCAKVDGKWYMLTMTSVPEETVTPTDV